MKQHTLLLPATIPHVQPLRQLLLLFDEIFMYRPCEEDGENPAETPYATRYAPVPFGDDLANFRQLLKDMTRNPADYYGSGISAMSAAVDVDEATVWQLIEQMAPKQAKKDATQEALYQARLLLALVELQEQKDAEIDHSMEEINNLSSQLMAALKGEEELFNLDEITPPISHNTNSNAMRHRLSAWSHLFLADKMAAQFTILTTGQDEFDLLGDHAGSNISNAPKKIFNLALPDCRRSSENFRQFPCAAGIFSVLEKAAADGVVDKKVIVEQQGKWQKHIDKHFEDQPTSVLDIYLFPNLSLPELMSKISRTSLADEVKESFPVHGILAVITKR